jgi:hypothetical protein
MSYHDGVLYDKTATFTIEVLGLLTPDDISRWMCYRCFGNPEPGNDDLPCQVRSTTLEVYKKALSWYMPNNMSSWNYINKCGNPTKSKELRNLIKYVKQREVRKQGKEPCTKRALTEAEFRAILLFFKSTETFQYKYRYYTMILYQYYLIARCDDVGHFMIKDLHGHTDLRFSDFALQTKVSWSKNVYEERDCPDQIFFGSFDSQYCLLLSMSIYLEIWLGDNTVNTNKRFLFGDGNDNAADDVRTVTRIKYNYSNVLRKYFVDFVRLSKELGTHSIRKFAASWARALGCLVDEIDSRGRWRKGSRKIVDRYINIDQQFLDARVAAALCVGGAIRYKLEEGSGITNDWLFENVVPGIKEYFGGDSIAVVLALPLLWACLHVDLFELVPLTLRSRIKEAYERIRVLDVEVSPVKRVFLSVTRYQDQVCIDEIVELRDNNGELVAVDCNTNNNNRSGGVNNEAVNLILSQIQQIKQTMSTQFGQLEQCYNNLRIELLEKYRIINKSINRIFIQPPRQSTQQQRNDREARNNFIEAAEALVRPELMSELSRAPRTLFDLWAEYAFGVGGNKAAKDFTFHERGKNRFAYCRRKVVWDCISMHVNAGYMAATAIDRILECYGKNQNVSAIIKMMVQDKKRGGHPNLRL